MWIYWTYFLSFLSHPPGPSLGCKIYLDILHGAVFCPWASESGNEVIYEHYFLRCTDLIEIIFNELNFMCMRGYNED